MHTCVVGLAPFFRRTFVPWGSNRQGFEKEYAGVKERRKEGNIVFEWMS